MTTRYEVRGDIAVITLDNPPVNSLGYATRRDIVEGLEQAARDPSVVAIVLTGAGRAFSAGADITEFSSPNAGRAPSLWTVLDEVESGTKPVVAALNAVALGGGLELALAAHFRVAVRGSKIGLPEVKIGVLPGAGGTQRLPRAIGLEQSLNMILSGDLVAVEDVANTRFLDLLIDEGDLIGPAMAFAHEAAGRPGPLPRIRDWRIDHPNPEGFIGFVRPIVASKSVNLPAPLKCLDAIEAAVTKSFEQGLKVEREAFNVLVETPESKSLRHAFFAERAAAKIPNLPKVLAPSPIGAVAVIGAGTMGSGIAMNFLNVGIPVTLVETKRDALDRGVATIRANYEASAKKGRLSSHDVEKRIGLLHPTLSLEDAGGADLVIEAVFEDLAIKEQVFKKLDALAKPGAILATNTSYLDIDRLAGVTKRPEHVLGLHFFSPANVMKLLEIVRGAKTDPGVLAAAMSIAGRIGKTAVISGVCDGFIGNRMLDAYLTQAWLLLEEGALPQQVDAAMEKFGFAMGPFRMLDLAGNDIAWAVRKRRAAEHAAAVASRIPDLLCEMGRFGQKTGSGWYDYKPKDRKAYPSPKIDELILNQSRELGLERRRISDGEIVGRLMYALVNEGAKILDEGIATRASDIDVVYLKGYGFPPWRGGPLFYADTVGLFNVVRAMRRYAEGRHGELWQPATMLVRLAETGGKFNQ